MCVSRLALAAIALATAVGCTQNHRVRVRSATLAPPERAEVMHSGRLFIELHGYTDDRQCGAPPGWRTLCYERIHAATERALRDVLWSSFPGVALRGHADDLEAGDYLLLVSVSLETLPPDAEGAGWSTGLKGQYRLVRDGMPVREAAVESRSRAEFAYGRALGVAAGEVIGAVAAHIGEVLAELPEPRPVVTQPLPPVVATPIPGATPSPTPVASR